MHFTRKMTLQALLLSVIVVVAGVTVGTIFFETHSYPVVDLQQWVQSDSTVLPEKIYIDFQSSSVTFPSFYSNTTKVEAYRVFTNHLDNGRSAWAVLTVKVVEKESFYEGLHESINSSGDILQYDTMVGIAEAFKETATEQVNQGTFMTAEEFTQLRIRWHDSGGDRFWFTSWFFGSDNNVMFLEATKDWVGLYGCTLEQWMDREGVTPIKNAQYYVVPKQSFDEATDLQYLQVWNQTIKDHF